LRDCTAAMEFLDGVMLKHRIACRPLEVETVLSVGIEIADARLLPMPKASSTETSSKGIQKLDAFVAELHLEGVGVTLNNFVLN